MGVLVLAGAAVGTVLLHRADDVSHGLTDGISPARIAAGQLQSALRDQETGTRGYLISADRQFLAPYYDGQQAEQVAAQAIRQRLGERADLIADLDAIETTAREWRKNYAEPVIAAVTPTAPNLVSRTAAELDKAEFDHLRALFETQNAHLAWAQQQAIDQARKIADWRDSVLGAMVLLFCLTATLLGVLTRRAVTLPLADLASACRRITEGNFGERISPPQRPKDIRDMAIDVENMRQRIVEALEVSRSATAQLDEQTAELRRSNAELEQFAYVASHDLQEPLRKVTSFCQLLEKRYGDKLDDRASEYIGYAVDGAKRMQVLINDLLSFSRVGRLGTTSAEVDLDDALDAALANLATAIEESDAQIVRPEHGLPQITGDPMLLTMLWQNLIGNAVKFRREDRAPRVVIDCQQRTDDIVVTVTDNGIGIAPEFTDKVFLIFQRLHGRDVYGGTGLGLALCKKIVEHHGGTIGIDTSYTDGTRFEFKVPTAQPGVEPDAELLLAGADAQHSAVSADPAEGARE
ncbi:ATP-binding protein [Mycobacterium sp. 852002-51163_SCH5372311]|uniref:sensor histidine kinase n=1 Tax=Mycobacterium sp. 852002-51163_SCH5372311 TaxID=1834097 RepID=UPI0009EF14C8|nr:sensor histidine kinase [Mycobacterium sp. 852002-51163_SCH5372311]